jgi:DNA adenine methylase
MVEPILKWAGGKRQLLDELRTRFPESYDSYHEPFFGGGAVFFEMAPDDGTINDTNRRLVNFYEQVRDRPDELVARCRDFEDPERDPDPGRPHADAKNYYYQQRELFNRRPRGEEFDPLEEAALLLYLNRTGFNGLYRENADGEFNVPVGRYASPDWVRARQVRAASETLQNATINCGDFEYVTAAADEGDLVYVDPPYEPVGRTADFNDYAAEGFDRDDQRRLLEVAGDLDDAGVHVVLSNSGVMYETYADAGFHVDVERATRAINSDADDRGAVDEIIATTVPPEQRAAAAQRPLSDF